MKRAPPSPPLDAPLGTVSLSCSLGWFSARLHVTSEELIPDEVTKLFGVTPTTSQTKGVAVLGPDGDKKRVPKFGRWSIELTPSQTDEWDINEVINELLAPLPTDAEIWHKVSRRGSLQISLGLLFAHNGDDFFLEPVLLHTLGERGIQVYFDFYREDGGRR
jgi:hypothetical protein